MHRHLFALALVLTSACGASSSSGTATTAPAQAEVATVTVDEVADAIGRNDGSMVIFDANSRETFAEHHVPGATWVQYDAITAASLPQDLGKRLVFYCGNERCSAAPSAARQAVELGYTNVAVMSAGIRGWLDAGKPVEATPATPSAQ